LGIDTYFVRHLLPGEHTAVDRKSRPTNVLRYGNGPECNAASRQCNRTVILATIQPVDPWPSWHPFHLTAAQICSLFVPLQ
jgi:hypothetical protein